MTAGKYADLGFVPDKPAGAYSGLGFVPDAAPRAPYGLRQDGTPKGLGYFGELKRPDGEVSTELSFDFDADGRKLRAPLLVPTLTRMEIERLLSGEKPTDEILKKAQDYAVGRLAENKSPFADEGETYELPDFTPMQKYDRRVKDWETAAYRWRQATGGRLAPGQTVEQAVEAFSGLQNPERDRTQYELEEFSAGGDLQYGSSVPYTASKILASMGGYAGGGPMGATMAESVVRKAAITEALEKLVASGRMTEDDAAERLRVELGKGMAEDAAWNFAVPFAAQIVKHIPGVKWLVGKALQKMARQSSEASQRAARIKQLKDKAGTRAEKQAVTEMTNRTGEMMPTPGQVTGRAGFGERIARMGDDSFDVQQKVLENAARDIREQTLRPPGQPSRADIGELVVAYADELEKAVKTRLRPVFKDADNSGVRVDFSDVLTRAKAAIKLHESTPGGKFLHPKEVADLRKVISDIEALGKPAKEAMTAEAATGLFDSAGRAITKTVNTPAEAAVPPLVNAESALDFISARKEGLRATTADWKPSAYYDTVMNSLVDAADKAFQSAARNSGKANLVTDLMQARSEYREMIEAVFDGVIKQALKRNPEDVGRLIWQRGNVTEPKQLQKMMQLVHREGALSSEGVGRVNAAIARGFLQEAVPDIKAAAKWSEMLDSDPLRRDTWRALTNTNGGVEMRHAMEVLEASAKMAVRGSEELVGGTLANIPLRRAASWGLGISLVTGTINMPMAAAGLSLVVLMRLMATSLQHADKGTLNLVTRVLRSQSAGTAAGAKALQELLPKLEEAAKEYGIENPIVDLREQLPKQETQ